MIKNDIILAEECHIYQSIRQFPGQFLEGWDQLLSRSDLNSWIPEGKIYYAAMGGSSLPADLVNDYLGGKLRLELIRDYRLPETAGPRDLVFVSSFSGNTEETLEALEDARARRCRIIAFSHGGELEAQAKTHGIPWIPIPDCIQPRCASGYFFSRILGSLFRLGLISSPVEQLKGLSAFLSDAQDACEARGKDLAATLHDRVPLIYGPSFFYGVGRIWKIKFNENAKIQSFSNVFPELNHNEMVGFTRLLMKPSLIFLESKFMHPRITRRMDVMQELLGKKIPIHRLDFQGAEPLHEMFESLAVADYASYHLAKAYGIDPAPVEMVEAFKKKL